MGLSCKPLLVCSCPARYNVRVWLQAARRALKRQLYLLALLIALRLKDTGLQREIILATPASEVSAVTCAPPVRGPANHTVRLALLSALGDVQPLHTMGAVGVGVGLSDNRLLHC